MITKILGSILFLLVAWFVVVGAATRKPDPDMVQAKIISLCKYAGRELADPKWPDSPQIAELRGSSWALRDKIATADGVFFVDCMVSKNGETWTVDDFSVTPD